MSDQLFKNIMLAIYALPHTAIAFFFQCSFLSVILCLKFVIPTSPQSVINQSIEFLSSFLKVDRLTQNITLQRWVMPI